MRHEAALQALLAADPARMRILRLVRDLRLPDGWVGAGFVRSLVWDHLHGRAPSPLPEDIDVIWYDRSRATPEDDIELEQAMRALDATLAWSVKNQARMHTRNGDQPYACAPDAMRYWPETATAVAVRLDDQDAIEIAAPFGLDDLFDLVVRPTPRFESGKLAIYRERIAARQWQGNWPRLTILNPA